MVPHGLGPPAEKQALTSPVLFNFLPGQRPSRRTTKTYDGITGPKNGNIMEYIEYIRHTHTYIYNKSI
jgi:hypothetical protein